jgi:protein-S-isoprenylcysteine O-methyltransferase Ste14
VRTLELRVPPLALVSLAVLSMWLIARAVPWLTFAIPWRVAAAIACAVVGTVIVVTAVAAFGKAHTTVNPLRPGAASAIVASGIYGWSRNPMYLGAVVVLAGWAMYLANAVSALVVPAFIAYVNRFQIAPEERALEARFGGSYIRYKARVRRWL